MIVASNYSWNHCNHYRQPLQGLNRKKNRCDVPNLLQQHGNLVQMSLQILVIMLEQLWMFLKYGMKVLFKYLSVAILAWKWMVLTIDCHCLLPKSFSNVFGSSVMIISSISYFKDNACLDVNYSAGLWLLNWCMLILFMSKHGLISQFDEICNMYYILVWWLNSVLGMLAVVK